MSARGYRRTCLALAVFLVAALAGLVLAAGQLRQAEARLRLARTLDLAPGHAVQTVPPVWESGLRRVLVAGDSRIARWAPALSVPGQDLYFSGIGGETTLELRRRMERDLPVFAPDHLVLAAGINDLVAASLNPAEAETVLPALAGNLQAVSAQARAAGSAVTLLTIVPPARPGLRRRALFWSDSIYDLTARANARIRALDAPGAGITVFDAAALFDAPPGGPLPAEFAADALHFNTRTYERLNAALTETLSGALDG